MPRFDRYAMPEQVGSANDTETLHSNAIAGSIRLAPSIASELPNVGNVQPANTQPNRATVDHEAITQRNATPRNQNAHVQTQEDKPTLRYTERTTAQQPRNGNAIASYLKAGGNMLRYTFGANEIHKVNLWTLVTLVASAACGMILSAVLTSAFLQIPFVGVLFAIMFTATQFAFWYQNSAPPIIRVMLFGMMLTSIGFNVAGLHSLTHEQFNLGSWKTWVFLLLGTFIDVTPEPFLLLAIYGTFQPTTKTPIIKRGK